MSNQPQPARMGATRSRLSLGAKFSEKPHIHDVLTKHGFRYEGSAGAERTHHYRHPDGRTAQYHEGKRAVIVNNYTGKARGGFIKTTHGDPAELDQHLSKQPVKHSDESEGANFGGYAPDSHGALRKAGYLMITDSDEKSPVSVYHNRKSGAVAVVHHDTGHVHFHHPTFGGRGVGHVAVTDSEKLKKALE